MRKKYWVLALILCLALAGCRQKTAQVTPAPSPKVETAAPSPSAATPSPETPMPEESESPAAVEDWKEDPKGYLFDCLDRILEEDELLIRFWQHPGSGPSPVYLSKAEYGETIRSLFEELDWDSARLLEGEEADDYVDAPGAYSITFQHSKWGFIGCTLNSSVIRADGREGNLYFRVDGAEKLGEKLTDMVPSAYVNLGRTRVPPQESKEATLKLYVETALERLKENGHISDYALRSYEVLTQDEENTQAEEEEYPTFAYTATYAMKPAKPELTYWQGYVFDEDGWVVEYREAYTDFLAYDERDGCYGMY